MLMNGKGRRVAGRIVVDERIMAGKPIVSGTRISVESIMR
ncbi:MAG: DUF433 domain-containing protein, partial [Candidatus Micrarchaeaceae archaeon]